MMGLFRKKEDPYHVLKPEDMKSIEDTNKEEKIFEEPDKAESEELESNECNFETAAEHICLLKSDKGKCDNESCLLWRTYQNA